MAAPFRKRKVSSTQTPRRTRLLVAAATFKANQASSRELKLCPHAQSDHVARCDDPTVIWERLSRSQNLSAAVRRRKVDYLFVILNVAT